MSLPARRIDHFLDVSRPARNGEEEGGMQNYLRAVWRCRYFWLSLVKMDLRARYRGSALGLGWSLLHPIAMTTIICTVFCVLFKQDLRTYAPLVFSGMTF